MLFSIDDLTGSFGHSPCPLGESIGNMVGNCLIMVLA